MTPSLDANDDFTYNRLYAFFHSAVYTHNIRRTLNDFSDSLSTSQTHRRQREFPLERAAAVRSAAWSSRPLKLLVHICFIRATSVSPISSMSMAELSAQDGRNYGPRSASYGHPANFQRDAAFQNIFGGAPPAGRSHTMTSQTPQMTQDRAQTMNSQIPGPMAQRGLPPVRHMNGSYDRAAPNGMVPSQSHVNGNIVPRPYPPYQAPMFPDRRPYPHPQRIDSSPGAGVPQFSNRPPPNRIPPLHSIPTNTDHDLWHD